MAKVRASVADKATTDKKPDWHLLKPFTIISAVCVCIGQLGGFVTQAFVFADDWKATRANSLYARHWIDSVATPEFAAMSGRIERLRGGRPDTVYLFVPHGASTRAENRMGRKPSIVEASSR